jgi:hypothetical protein
MTLWSKRVVRVSILGILVALLACGDDGPSGDAPDASGGGDADGGRDGGARDGGLGDDAGANDGGSADDASEDPVDAGTRLGAAAWIRAHFAGAPTTRGELTSRNRIETPALVDGADACCAKYAFDFQETEAPDDRRAGLVDVVIHDLVSTDAFGGGVQTSGADGMTLYLADVTIDPGWPTWVSYAETNYDGMVLDGSDALYAEALTIRDWNADGGIDNKAAVSQLVRFRLEGRGHRGVRYWAPGPHYLVESTLENTGDLGEGVLFWFRDCSTVELRVWDTTFNGEATVPAGAYSCDDGSDPTIVYLTEDPRTTGELHEMFSY